jgi:hypothetical protein
MEAAGPAAMLSVQEEASPRELDTDLLRRQLRRQGAIVDEGGIGRANA